MTTTSLKAEQFNNIIEGFRSSHSRPHIVSRAVSVDGKERIVGLRPNGTEYPIDAHVKGDHLVLHVSHETIQGGYIDYWDTNISLTARFSGEPVTVHIPYSCLLFMHGNDESGTNRIMELDTPSTTPNDFPDLPVWMVIEIVKYMGKTRPGVPCVIGLKDGDHIDYAHLEPSAISQDRFSLNVGYIEPVVYSFDASSSTNFELTPDYPLNGKATDRCTIVALFSPGPDFTFMTTPEGMRIFDDGLTAHLEAAWKVMNPMGEVLTDKDIEQEVQATKLELVPGRISAGEAEPVTERADVGETTEVTRGNVTAVDFRNRKVLK